MGLPLLTHLKGKRTKQTYYSDEDAKKREPSALFLEMQNGATTVETSSEGPHKVKIEVPHPAITLLGYAPAPEDSKQHLQEIRAHPCALQYYSQ